jgi:hypothetical protein
VTITVLHREVIGACNELDIPQDRILQPPAHGLRKACREFPKDLERAKAIKRD